MVLPIETYTFTLTRLRYLSAAAQNIPGFKPDGKETLFVNDQPALCSQAFTDLLGKFNAMNVTAGLMRATFDAMHDACVAVYGCMKSHYRKDPDQTRAIRSLPKDDRSPERTLARMKALVSLWGTLPPVPGTNLPFTVGEITAASFGSMASDFDAKVNSARLAESQYVGRLAQFHEQLAGWNNFVSAAATQGRALYRPGTAERAYIDRIPTEPATQEPEQAVITLAESPAPGVARLRFEAEHATSFKVRHKGPGEPAFTEVADVLLPGEYAATGLAEGTHEYEVVPVNSRGQGPASAVASIPVAAALAA
jgi:hypothetical protein